MQKLTQPDEVLFRFDHERPNVLKGAHYCERIVVLDDDGSVLSSVQQPAQPVSIAAGVQGLDLASIVGTIVLGQQKQLDDQAAAIAEHGKEIAAKDADLAAKDANIQDLMTKLADTQAKLDSEIVRNGVIPVSAS